MSLAAALVYWVIVGLWLTVLGTLLVFYVRNQRVFGATRLLLAVVAIDTLRNIIENVYFGVYFGAQYGIFSSEIVPVLGRPYLLILPKLANVAAGCVVLVLLLRRWLPAAVLEHEKSEQNAVDLKGLTAIDGLTGLYNRRQFEALGRAEWARFQRHVHALSLVIVGIDEFKSINERFGESAGDSVLRMIAAACSSAKRDSDIVGRVGSHEIALLLPDTDAAAARIAVERLREAVRDSSLTILDQRIEMTVSIGIANASLSMAGFDQLIKNASDALAQAKGLGSDHVVTASATAGKDFAKSLAIAAE